MSVMRSFAHGVIEPVREDEILDEQVLLHLPGLVRNRIVASHERIGRQLPGEADGAPLTRLRQTEENIRHFGGKDRRGAAGFSHGQVAAGAAPS